MFYKWIHTKNRINNQRGNPLFRDVINTGTILAKNILISDYFAVNSIVRANDLMNFK